MRNYSVLDINDANKRFGIQKIFSEYHSRIYEGYNTYLERAVVFEGDAILDSLNEEELSKHGRLLVVTGDLTVNNGFRLLDAEDGIRAVLVLGSVQTPSLTVGSVDFHIQGNLTLERYLHSPRPEYEQGTLNVEGETRVPLIVQESICPYFQCNVVGNTTRFTRDDLSGLGKSIYDPDDFYIESFISWVKEESTKDVTKQKGFNWYDYLTQRNKFSIYKAGEQLASMTMEQYEIYPAEEFNNKEIFKEVRLANHPLKEFPAQILQCEKLEKLSLLRVLAHIELPDLSSLRHLKILEISGEPIYKGSAVSQQIVRSVMAMNLSRLQFLELSDFGESDQAMANQKIRGPLASDYLTGISRFTALQGVDLTNNGLAELPDEFFALNKQLKFANLQYNDFTSDYKKKIKKHFKGVTVYL
jgi:hypothetical protein